MADEQQMHVLGLTPSTQIALRYIMQNFFMVLIRESMTDMIPEQEDMKKKALMRQFETYTAITDMLSTPWSKQKNRLICVAPIGMKFLEAGVKWYDQTHNYLIADERARVIKELPDIQRRVAESAKFTYTDAELSKMGATKP